MTVPKTHRAAQVTEAGGRLVIQERPTPTPGPSQVLIRNHVVAVNPIDWKRVAFGIVMNSFPVVIGIGKPQMGTRPPPFSAGRDLTDDPGRFLGDYCCRRGFCPRSSGW